VTGTFLHEKEYSVINAFVDVFAHQGFLFIQSLSYFSDNLLSSESFFFMFLFLLYLRSDCHLFFNCVSHDLFEMVFGAVTYKS
jgi:hypothetical protein